MKRLIVALFLMLVGSSPTWAASCPSLPYNLTNGTTADASQVMGNFNNLLTCANNVTDLVAVQVFSSPGTYTYTCNPATSKIIVEVVSGGGGGAGAGASSSSTGSAGVGGSSGGFFKGFATSRSAFCGATVTVGAAGAGGTGTAAPGNGGSSSFVLSGGVNITITGGRGNTGPTAVPGGMDGNNPAGSVTSATGVNYTLLSGSGQAGGWSAWNSAIGISGKGGDTPWGVGGSGMTGVSGANFQQGGFAGSGYGCGGGGAMSLYMSSGGANQTGGNGCAGAVIVWELM